MNVEFTNNINSIISILRNKVYGLELFKDSFKLNLEPIGATKVSFVPSQFGGWTVNVIMDINKMPGVDSLKSELVNPYIRNSLINTISSVLNSFDNVDSKVLVSTVKNPEISSNLFNCVISGPNSVTIQI